MVNIYGFINIDLSYNRGTYPWSHKIYKTEAVYCNVARSHIQPFVGSNVKLHKALSDCIFNTNV